MKWHLNKGVDYIKNHRSPARHPLIILLMFHSPFPTGINFHISRTVTPPDPQAMRVATVADPIALPSPGSLTEA